MVVNGRYNVEALGQFIYGKVAASQNGGYQYFQQTFLGAAAHVGYYRYEYVNLFIKTVEGETYVDYITYSDQSLPTANPSINPAATFIPEQMTLAAFQNAAAGSAVELISLLEREVITAYGTDNSSDILHGGDLADRLYGYAGQDTLDGGSAGDFLDGGEGSDTASYVDATEPVGARLDLPSYNSGDAFGDTYVSIENLLGSRFNDVLVGNVIDNSISGFDGDDLLFGLDGNDMLFGETGNDSLWGGLGTDYIAGGYGYDYARFDYATGAVNVWLDLPAYNSGEAAGDFYFDVEGLVGSIFADVLVGDGNGNTLLGLDGDDTLYGQSGNDALIGGLGNDQFYGGFGTDYMDGGEGFDYSRYDFSSTGVAVSLASGIGSGSEAEGDFMINIEGLVGSGFADFLGGDAGTNTIYGQSGDDIILGGQGADSLNGGLGNDTFAFQAADFQRGIYDRVKDFSETGGNFDIVSTIGVPFGQIQLFDTPSGAFITTLDLAGSGGVIFEGITVGQIQDQLYIY
jgi:Ca2+-binding RTX toxin-like protein